MMPAATRRGMTNRLVPVAEEQVLLVVRHTLACGRVPLARGTGDDRVDPIRTDRELAHSLCGKSRDVSSATGTPGWLAAR